MNVSKTRSDQSFGLIYIYAINILLQIKELEKKSYWMNNNQIIWSSCEKIDICKMSDINGGI